MYDLCGLSNGPSKQNETHFNLRVFTDKDIIKKIHDTKVYALFNGSDVDEVFEDQKDEWGEKFHTKETHTIITLKYMQMLYLYSVMIKKI